MKAVVIKEPGKVSLQQVEIPKPQPGFVLVKVKAAAICATDLEILDGNISANYPLIPGHEWSGIVEAAGSFEDQHWIGKRVIGSNDVVCLKCEACRSGDWRYCKEFEEIGFKRNGAYAEYVVVPSYGLCELPEKVSFIHGAFCEPLGVALGTLEKAEAKFGDTCLIMGAGSIGLCMLATAKSMGMKKIVVCASTEKRLKIAREMGAYATIATNNCDLQEEMKKIHPGGTDVIIDATGIESCIQQCLKLARKGGTVALAGYGRGKIMNIRMDDIHINNLRVIGAGNNWNQHKKAVNLMEDGLVNIEHFATNLLSLEEYEKGLELARKRPEGFVKAVFLL
ncbi:MAG: alcohol dehydrogenase catalytic domain-containing protein [Lachnospiraceae bacterium]|nr:alcohol dehydrogenase catalytic domain-containing protein [Lachnospiraceae bacterium]